MARQGLNCTLSYERANANHTYRIRVGQITHGIQMLGTESQARMVRAFYPRRATTQRFFLNVLLKGYQEHKDLTNWLMDYVSYAIDPNHAGPFRSMNVIIPGREFSRNGIPLRGYHWGDRVGKILWGTTLEFEASSEPWENWTPTYSEVDNLEAVYEKEKNAKHWYPEGIQLGGDSAPIDYDRVVRGFSDRWNQNDSSGTGSSSSDQDRADNASRFQDRPGDFGGGL